MTDNSKENRYRELADKLTELDLTAMDYTKKNNINDVVEPAEREPRRFQKQQKKRKKIKWKKVRKAIVEHFFRW